MKKLILIVLILFLLSFIWLIKDAKALDSGDMKMLSSSKCLDNIEVFGACCIGSEGKVKVAVPSAEEGVIEYLSMPEYRKPEVCLEVQKRELETIES